MAKNILKNKKILLALGFLAIAALCGALYLKHSQDQVAKSDQQVLQEEEKKAGERDPKSESEAYQRAQAKTQNQTPQASASSTKSDASPTITSYGQSGDMVYVNAIVDNQTSGTCTLTMSKGDTTVTRTAPLGLVTSYYACQGFSVERSAFNSGGVWSIVVMFNNATSKGSSETKKINIQ